MIQPQQLHLPTQRDPVARLALGALAVAALLVAFAAPSVPVESAQAQVLATPQAIIVIATPTAGLPTEQPAAVLAAPTIAAPTLPPVPPAEPQIVQVPVYVEVTAPPAAPDPNLAIEQAAAQAYQTLPTLQLSNEPTPAGAWHKTTPRTR